MGCNTKYFQLVANGKRRITRNYYKGLFGKETNGLSMMESRTEDIAQVTIEENELLAESFHE